MSSYQIHVNNPLSRIHTEKNILQGGAFLPYMETASQRKTHLQFNPIQAGGLRGEGGYSG